MNKRILFIAYFTPPYGAVGAVRVTKFIKYLIRFGWDVTVVSIKTEYYSELNEKWIEEIKGAKVIRTKIGKTNFPGLKEEGVYWYPFLKRELEALLRKESFKLSFWSGGPFYHWTLAPKLFKKYGLKYVLDFRDPWSLHPYRPTNKFSKIRDFINRKLEQRVLKYAFQAINVTIQGTEMYKAAYPKHKEKFVTLPNGFDPEDFKNVNPKCFSNFDIIYTGKFGIFRNPIPFFKAFQSFVKNNRLTHDEIQFVWVGAPENNIREQLKQHIDEKFYTITGFMPYNHAIEYIQGAGLSLLIAGNHPYEPTTKIFDYLALKKPILAISDTQGFITKALSNIDGSRVERNNVSDIMNALSIFYFEQNNLANQTSSNPAVANNYNREKNTEILQEWLIKILNK